MKNAFLMPYEYKEQFDKLTDEELGRITRAMFDYEINLKKPNFTDRFLGITWDFIQQKLDLFKQNYDKRCVTSAENGRLGGRPPKSVINADDKPNCENLNNLTENLTKPKKADNDSVSDSVRINDSVSKSVLDRGVGEDVAIAPVRTQKHRYGKFKNVLLTEAEYARLIAEPDGVEAIEFFSYHREMKGYKCKEDNLAIRKWAFTAVKEERQKNQRNNKNNSDGNFVSDFREMMEGQND